MHTPGSWFVVKNGRQTDVHARILPDGESPREKTIASNLDLEDARLIAQLPTLLRALTQLISAIEADDPFLYAVPDLRCSQSHDRLVDAVIAARAAIGGG